jgi:hypothetical protein
MYRGLRKSISAVTFVIGSAKAGRDDSGRVDLPVRSNNLPDRQGEHNRAAPESMRRCGHGGAVDLAISSLYSRRAHPLCGSPRSNSEGEMTTFDKREEGFEKKFAHDEELKFKATARRNKLLGLWAAEKLGLAGPEAEAYAKEVVLADFEEGGNHDVFKKIRKDFDAKGVAQSDHQIRRTMDELLDQAIAQVKAAR